MTKLNRLAEELNEILKNKNGTIFNLLSERGRAIYFPKTGIVGQSREAKGKKINATIGIALEDDGSPIHLSGISDLIHLDPKEIFPYADTYGKSELRKKWKELILQKNPNLTGEISEPVVTAALTHGLSLFAYLFVNPGEKIIMADKFWGNYRLTFEIEASGIIETFNTFKDDGFDTQSFKSKISEGQGKKIILLNFPNNPAGHTPTKKEVKQISEIILERAEIGDEIVVLLDDAYFGLVYEDEITKESLFSELANIHEKVLAVKIDGATKEYYAWGLRVGFLTYGIKGGTKEIYNALETKTAGALRGQISNVSLLSQSLVYKALISPSYESEKQQKFELLKSRYLAVKKTLANPKYAEIFTALPFNSGYFMCLKLNSDFDPETVRKILLGEYDTGVVALPGGLIRIAYSSVAERDIPELLENIYLACKNNG